MITLRADIQLRLTPVMGESEARAVTLLLLSELFNITTVDILTGDYERKISGEDKNRLEQAVRRLENHEPVQYVIGHAAFSGLSFDVNPNVLIPRPETEELVSIITSNLHHLSNLSVLDIGTGSGCIAISLSKQLKDSQVEGWDISSLALEVATANAKKNDARVLFRKMDILDSSTLDCISRKYDVIVSNPPYICQSEAKQMDSNVLEHEPHKALFVPDDQPLLFYEAIARFASTKLNQGGHIYLEINRRFPRQTESLLSSCGFTEISTLTDQFGNPRFVTAVKG